MTRNTQYNTSKIGIMVFVFASISMITMAQSILTVPYVDLERYAGKWYEIASISQRFQKDCTCTTAEYTVTDQGYVVVENRCIKEKRTDKPAYIKGKAFVVEKTGNAQLNIQFYWPFKGKYWVIKLADDYSYAVVSHPNKKYLWILSRTPTMDPMTYELILTSLRSMNFDLTQLKTTKQI